MSDEEKTVMDEYWAGQSEHKYFAVVQHKGDYVGGCCFGPKVFIVIATKTIEKLKEEFERVLKASFTLTMYGYKDNEYDEDTTSIETAMEEGTILELFNESEEKLVNLCEEEFVLLHYGDDEDSSYVNLYCSDE